MTKYSTELKIKVVKAYLNNEDRIKAKLGYLSPVEYRELNAA